MLVLVQGKSLAPIPEEETEFEEDNYLDETKSEENEEKQGDSNEVEESERRENDAAPTNNGRSESEEYVASQHQTAGEISDQQTSGWQTIPKPKGHSHLDYSRWDRVEDDSSEEDDGESDDDDDGSQPQYRFRVKTVGVRAVK